MPTSSLASNNYSIIHASKSQLTKLAGFQEQTLLSRREVGGLGGWCADDTKRSPFAFQNYLNDESAVLQHQKSPSSFQG